MTAAPLPEEALASDAAVSEPAAEAISEPAAVADVLAGRPRRPPLGRLVRYCYTGSAPAEYREWVLHDVTCRTWMLRHFARWTMAIVPLFLVYLAVMPTDFGTRLYTGVAFALGLYVMSLVFILIDSDRRAVLAGYEHSRPQAVRTANSVARQRAANYQRRERIAERKARRGR